MDNPLDRYLEPLNKTYHLSRALRSSSRSLLCTPAIKSKTHGGRAFSTAAPQLWNTIPEYVKMQTVLPRLKQNLKHFYSGNISIDFMLNIFIFFSILKFTILHVYVTQARHFSYFSLFLIIM